MPLPRSALTGALLLWSAAAPAAESQRLRDWFRFAWTAAQVGEDQSAHEAELRGYVLYPYLRAERLRHRLAQAPDESTDDAVARFLERHGAEPVGQSLRAAWLPSLARRGRWELILLSAPPDTSDPALRCHRLAARIALGQLDGLLDDALGTWLSGQELPGACDPIATWLDAQQALAPVLVEQRIRLALQSGQPRLARALAQRLAPPRAAPLLAAAALLETPDAEFGRQIVQGLPADNAVVLEAFWSLARRDALKAHLLLDALMREPQFTDAERGQLQRAVALGLAYDRRPEALGAFRTLPEDAADAHAQEWRVRSAIWNGDWAQALVWIDRMAPAARQEARWRYWRARALEQLKQAEPAQALFAEVAREREYYGFLAAERVGASLDLRHSPLPAQPQLGAALLGRDGVIRARELLHCDLPDQAAAEWAQALRGAEPALRQEAARLAASWGWHRITIAMLAELALWDDVEIRYPLQYEPEVQAAVEETGLPAEWIYAVLRQESLYNPRAASGANALGLLQLRLPDARQVARKNRQPSPDRDDLFDPRVNVRLGALYLRELNQRFGGRWIVALAGYNAGPYRVPSWLPARPVPADVWIENIPFNETRSYVQRILANMVIFRWRRGGEPLRLAPLLEPVGAALAEERT